MKRRRPLQPRLTPRLIQAIDSVLYGAITNMCGCVGPGTGYLGHQRDCHVHMRRDELKRIQKFLDAARAWLSSRALPESPEDH
jgi:hypothetical protein